MSAKIRKVRSMEAFGLPFLPSCRQERLEADFALDRLGGLVDLQLRLSAALGILCVALALLRGFGSLRQQVSRVRGSRFLSDCGVGGIGGRTLPPPIFVCVFASN